jgi:hypothetical protein
MVNGLNFILLQIILEKRVILPARRRRSAHVRSETVSAFSQVAALVG